MIDLVKVSQSGDSRQSSIVVEPLPQGFGLTLGNSLRRVLLSSLTGAAITQAKIDGVQHEYSTIKGVKEDVVELLLNLKKIRLTIEGEKSAKLELDAKGLGEVKAKDIKLPAGVQIANPDLHIASLAEKSKLSIEMTAEKGQGFLPVESRRSLGIGRIPLDATFSPIVKVNYKVEPIRVGQMTNFDKLTLFVTTDGTITPAEAVKNASKILQDYFAILVEQRKQPIRVQEPPVSAAKISKNASVEELELSTRVTNALKNANIDTVEKLIETPKEELVKLKNMGAKSISDIEEKLKEKGLI
ncbi:MAG: DNA-directed RNA polymerase subunit alpha [Candidatus Woykebacteria bacterium RBG_13_40_15]|uniref:DNA-directed RNA polymerase subunit alpha n=1 Tax=Candidatus Woykebacteria bacterium RBG_13_40_15 TaxID=1802593 RepID=A0A1G1W937_9BACT|nr:MAG: DNA-directed RNA polymerase subunit alpha [Candidatus Woykebacteria bacterium RBG_13_40_15]